MASSGRRSGQEPAPEVASNWVVNKSGMTLNVVAFSIVKREAELRKSDNYLSQTKRFVLAGRPCPIELDQECQSQALRDFGFDPNPEVVKEYQSIVSMLPVEVRKEVFFLSANDRFFLQKELPKSMELDKFLAWNSSEQEDWAATARQHGCSKIFIMASTST